MKIWTVARSPKSRNESVIGQNPFPKIHSLVCPSYFSHETNVDFSFSFSQVKQHCPRRMGAQQTALYSEWSNAKQKVECRRTRRWAADRWASETEMSPKSKQSSASATSSSSSSSWVLRFGGSSSRTVDVLSTYRSQMSACGHCQQSEMTSSERLRQQTSCSSSSSSSDGSTSKSCVCRLISSVIDRLHTYTITASSHRFGLRHSLKNNSLSGPNKNCCFRKHRPK